MPFSSVQRPAQIDTTSTTFSGIFVRNSFLRRRLHRRIQERRLHRVEKGLRMHLRPSVGTVPLWDRPWTQPLWIVLPIPIPMDCSRSFLVRTVTGRPEFNYLPSDGELTHSSLVTCSPGTLWQLCPPYGRQHNHPVADVSGAPHTPGEA